MLWDAAAQGRAGANADGFDQVTNDAPAGDDGGPQVNHFVGGRPLRRNRRRDRVQLGFRKLLDAREPRLERTPAGDVLVDTVARVDATQRVAQEGPASGIEHEPPIHEIRPHTGGRLGATDN